MSPEELQRLFARDPMAMKAHYDRISASRPRVYSGPYGRGIEGVRQRRADSLANNPMIGRGEMAAPVSARPAMEEFDMRRPAPGPDVRARELEPPSEQFLRAAGVAPQRAAAPVEQKPAPVDARGETVQPPSGDDEQPGWFARRRNNFDNALSGIAAAFANSKDPSWGQIGAAMASGAAEGRARQGQEQRQNALFALEQEKAQLARDELTQKRAQSAATEEWVRTLEPEQQRLFRALGDKALDRIMPKPADPTKAPDLESFEEGPDIVKKMWTPDKGWVEVSRAPRWAPQQPTQAPETWSLVPPDEAAKLGYRPGTVVSRSSRGDFQVEQAPESGGADDGAFRTLSPKEATELGLPSGGVYQMSPKGEIKIASEAPKVNTGERFTDLSDEVEGKI